jgi:hypothetical protein
MTINAKKTAIGLLVSGALAAAAYFAFNGSNDYQTPVNTPGADPMTNAAAIVAANLAKPCAKAAGEISAILLSDPNLTCNGTKVVAPSVK